MNQIYLDTARLLTQVAPLVFVDDTFALKGGTAINLFVRDMPRLSVDLDLVFPDHTLSRDKALARIQASLRQAADRLKKRGFQTHASAADVGETKLLVRRGRIEIKVEVNFVMRGTVRPVRRASLTPTAREVLMADLDIPVVSLEDMYGGKLVAALDRQHPRDLFDVMLLFAHEGITPGIRRAFVVYLASSNRPVHEVLFPPLRDIRRDYEYNFQGMTAEPVPLDALLAARERMVRELQQGLDDDERRFLLSLVAGAPDWSLLNIAHLEHLPFGGSSMIKTPHPAYHALMSGFEKAASSMEARLPGPEKVAAVIYRSATDNSTRLRYPVIAFPLITIRKLFGARIWTALMSMWVHSLLMNKPARASRFSSAVRGRKRLSSTTRSQKNERSFPKIILTANSNWGFRPEKANSPQSYTNCCIGVFGFRLYL